MQLIVYLKKMFYGARWYGVYICMKMSSVGVKYHRKNLLNEV